MSRFYRAIAVLLIGGAILSGCVEQQPYSMPETMPDDFAFLVRFGIESKNEINTFDHTVTKDLVLDGTAKAEVQLTPREMQAVYEKMKEINIVARKQFVPKAVNCEKTPHGEDRWDIRLNGQTVRHEWSGRYCNVTEDARQFAELRNYVFELVKSKEAYRKLPESRGGYD